MSRLPCPQQHIAQVPDRKRYVAGIDKCALYTTLPSLCRVRTCGLQATEEHHVVRRSFTRSWAIRDYALLYGEIVPVKVPLCAAHHRDCTENRAAFEFTPGEGFVFWAELTEGNEDRSLGTDKSTAVLIGDDAPSPGSSSSFPSVSSGHDESGLTEGEKRDQAADSPAANPTGMDSGSPSVNPGQSCPTCQRRVPYPKKSTSPDTKVISLRIPLDELGSFEENLEAAAEYVGVLDRPHWKSKIIALGVALVLQDPKLRDYGKRVGERAA